MRGETEADKKIRLREEELEKRKNKKWNWFKFIYRLADGNVLKFEEASKLNIVFAFSFLSFESDNKNIVLNTKTKPVVTT